MRRLNDYINSERDGFAITFELLMTMLMIATFVFITTYFAEVMQTRRFFADVASSTCAMASRYGGNNSNAYKVQVQKYNVSGKSPQTIEDNANAMLKALSGRTKSGKYEEYVFMPQDNGKFIKVSDVSEGNNEVTVTMDYRLGNYGWAYWANKLGLNDKVTHYKVTLPSLMQSGKLINAG